ncbi:MAG: hypothetical protein LBK18_05100 [Prevotellaceae bacterium]|jgi:hypothetical protein|nr:hypothetical protein [Prevotellaceae bacterium]
MRKIIIILAALAASAQGRGEDGKFSSAFGVGGKRAYNNMLIPYEFSGSSYGLQLEWQTLNPGMWLSDMQLNLRYNVLFASNRAIDVKILNAAQERLGATAQYRRMVKVAALLDRRLSLYAGGSAGVNVEYEFFIDATFSSAFLTLDFSLGAALYAEYRLGATLFAGSFSMPLVAGTFYPHYGTGYIPFSSAGSAADYFVMAPVGTLNRVSSDFRVERPIYIGGRFINTFFLGYHFGYEYSTIRDNPVRSIDHTVLLGVVFKISAMM